MEPSISSFNTFVEQELNPAQHAAVTKKDGVLLVIAGAGSGKTRVITARIAQMMLHNTASAPSLAALTFTNKAAIEMRERIVLFLGHSAPLPFIGTFHSYCLKLLKTHVDMLDVPFISILDEDDQQKILHGIITRNNLGKQITSKQLAYHISRIKNQSARTDDEWSMQNPIFVEIYHAYEHEKRLSKCLDFDDLLLETLKLFKKNSVFKTQFQSRVRHILVDEYQDTNGIQHELLKEMTINDDKQLAVDSLCVVGDEDQSIYSWRGATIANIINFKKDYPTAEYIKIEQNYRCVQPILEIANTIIAHNKNRNPKKLWSEKKGNNRVKSIMCMSDLQEADAIAQLVKVQKKKNPLSTIAILYRTHFQSRTLEEGLIKNSLPYKIIGGVQFYERKEIKDLLGYLKLIVNPFDRASFFRVINTPLRGLGAKFEEQFLDAWNYEPLLNFTQIAQHLLRTSEQPKAKQETLQQFLDIFIALSSDTAPSKALSEIITKTSYRTHIKESCDRDESYNRLENIKELLNAVVHFEEKGISTIPQLLDEIALMQAHYQSSDEQSNPVLMMTLHAAKGLEFDTVIISGLEDGILPSTRSLTDEAAIEEERRLLYVGVTRARDYLLLIHSRYRYQFGSMNDQRPSRFLKDIPSMLVCTEDASHWQTPHLTNVFKQWLGIATQHNVDTSMPVYTFKAASTSSFTPAMKSPTSNEQPTSSWKKNQPVKHAVFGIGIVKEVEVKNIESTYLTISFKIGTKKIAASFVTPV